MDCDVDLASFTQHPFVVERPAEGGFADAMTDRLARAGLRIEYGEAPVTVAVHDSILEANLPPSAALLSRTGCRKGADNATVLVCGEARAFAFAASAQPALAMSLPGLTMLGHAVSGPDRATAIAFASLSAMRSGASDATLGEFAKTLTHQTASLAWNAASRIPGYVGSCRMQLENNPNFLTADAVSMERNARVAAVSALKAEYRSWSSGGDRLIADVRLRMEKGLGLTGDRPSPDEQLKSDLGADHSGPSADEPKARFAAEPFGTKRFGPSYLPLHKFNAESLRVVQGLHPDLLKVVARASEISGQEFQVVPGTGGMRSDAMQRKLKAKGASRAKLGRHTFGYAIDLAPTDKKGRVDFRNAAGFDEIMRAMKQASEELGIPVDWGGSWKKLVDKPHYELNRKVYPGPNEEAKPEAVLVAFR